MNKKLNEFIEYIKTEKPSVEVAEKKTREYFSEMIIYSNNINQAYYKYNVDTIYIKNSDGVSIIIGKGPADILGSHYSNEGINITITTIDNDYLLYNSSELDLDCLPELEKDLNIQVDESMAVELLNHSDPLMIETFTSDLQTNNKVMQAFLERTWYLSRVLHEQQISDANVSPNDGLDVRQLSIEENYLELIDIISSNKIKEEAIKYFFSKENSEYFIKEKITDLERKIDFVIKKEEYHKLDNLLNKENELYNSLNIEYGIDDYDSLIDKLKDLSVAIDLNYEELQNVDQQINELENEVKKIDKQQFNLWQRIKGEPVKQLKILNGKFLELISMKEEKDIDITLIRLKREDLLNKYNKSQDIKHKINSLIESSNLKNSFTLEEDDEKFYEKRLNLYRKELTKYQDLLKSYENFKEKQLLDIEDEIESYTEAFENLQSVDMVANVSWYSSDSAGIKETMENLNEAIERYYNSNHKIPEVTVSLSVNNNKLFNDLPLDKKIIHAQLNQKEVNVLKVLKNSVVDRKTLEQLDILEEQLDLNEQMDLSQNLSISM